MKNGSEITKNQPIEPVQFRYVYYTDNYFVESVIAGPHSVINISLPRHLLLRKYVFLFVCVHTIINKLAIGQ